MALVRILLLAVFMQAATSQNRHANSLDRWRSQGNSNNVRQNALETNRGMHQTNVRQRINQNGNQGQFFRGPANNANSGRRPMNDALRRREQTNQARRVFRPGVSSLPKDSDGNVIRPRTDLGQISQGSNGGSFISRTGNRAQSNSRSQSGQVSSVPIQQRGAPTSSVTRTQPNRQPIANTFRQPQRSLVPSASRRTPIAPGSTTVVGPGSVNRQGSGRSQQTNNLITDNRPSFQSFDPALFDRIAMTRRMPRNSTNISNVLRRTRVNSLMDNTGPTRAARGRQLQGRSNVRSPRPQFRQPTVPQTTGERSINLARQSTVASSQEQIRTNVRLPSRQQSRSRSESRPEIPQLFPGMQRNFQPPNPISPAKSREHQEQDSVQSVIDAILRGNIVETNARSQPEPVVGRLSSLVSLGTQDLTSTRQDGNGRRRQVPTDDVVGTRSRQRSSRRLTETTRQSRDSSALRDSQQRVLPSSYEEHINYKVRALLNGQTIDMSVTPPLNERSPPTQGRRSTAETRPSFPDVVLPFESAQPAISRTPIRITGSSAVAENDIFRLSSSNNVFEDNSLQVSPDRRRPNQNRRSEVTRNNILSQSPVERIAEDNVLISPRDRTSNSNSARNGIRQRSRNSGTWEDILNLDETPTRPDSNQTQPRLRQRPQSRTLERLPRRRVQSERAVSSANNLYWWETLEIPENSTSSRQHSSNVLNRRNEGLRRTSNDDSRSRGDDLMNTRQAFSRGRVRLTNPASSDVIERQRVPEFRPPQPVGLRSPESRDRTQSGPSLRLSRTVQSDINEPLRRDRFGRIFPDPESTSSAQNRNDNPRNIGSNQGTANSQSNGQQAFDLDLFLSSLSSTSSRRESPQARSTQDSRMQRTESSLEQFSDIPTQPNAITFERSSSGNFGTRRRSSTADSAGREEIQTERISHRELRRNNDQMREGRTLSDRRRTNDVRNRDQTLSEVVVSDPTRARIRNANRRRDRASMFTVSIGRDVESSGNRDTSTSDTGFNITAFLESLTSNDASSQDWTAGADNRDLRRGRTQSSERQQLRDSNRRNSPSVGRASSNFDSFDRGRQNRQRNRDDSRLRQNDNQVNTGGRLFGIQVTNENDIRTRDISSISDQSAFNRQQETDLRRQTERVSSRSRLPNDRIGRTSLEGRFGNSDGIQEQRNARFESDRRRDRTAIRTSRTTTTEPPWVDRPVRQNEGRTVPEVTTPDPWAFLLNEGRTREGRNEQLLDERNTNDPPSIETARPAARNNNIEPLTQVNNRQNVREQRRTESLPASQERNRNSSAENDFDLQAFLASFDQTSRPLSTTISTTTTTTTTQAPTRNNFAGQTSASDPSLRLELNSLALADTALFSPDAPVLPSLQPINRNETNSGRPTQRPTETRDSSFLAGLLGIESSNNILPMGDNIINEIPTIPTNNGPNILNALQNISTVDQTTVRTTTIPIGRTSTSSSQNREIRIALDSGQNQSNGQNKNPTVIVLQIRPDGTIVNATDKKHQERQSQTLSRTTQRPTARSTTETTSTLPPTTLPTTTISSTTQQPTTIRTTASTTVKLSSTTDEVSGLRAQLDRQNSLLQELLKSVGVKGDQSSPAKQKQNIASSSDALDSLIPSSVPSLDELIQEQQPRVLDSQSGNRRRNLIALGQSKKEARMNPGNRTLDLESGNQASRHNQPTLSLGGRIGSLDVKNTSPLRERPKQTTYPIDNTDNVNTALTSASKNAEPLHDIGNVYPLRERTNQIDSPLDIALQIDNTGDGNLNEAQYDILPSSNKTSSQFVPLELEPEIAALRAAFDSVLFDRLAMTRRLPSKSSRRSIENSMMRRMSPPNKDAVSLGPGIKWLSNRRARHSQGMSRPISVPNTRPGPLPVSSELVDTRTVRTQGASANSMHGVPTDSKEIHKPTQKHSEDIHAIPSTLNIPQSVPAETPMEESYSPLGESIHPRFQSEEMKLAIRNIFDKFGQERATGILKDIAKSSDPPSPEQTFHKQSKTLTHANVNSKTRHEDLSMNTDNFAMSKVAARRGVYPDTAILSERVRNAINMEKVPQKPSTTEIPFVQTERNANLGLIGDSRSLIDRLIRKSGDITNVHNREEEHTINGIVNGEKMKLKALDLPTLHGRFFPIVNGQLSSTTRRMHSNNRNVRRKGRRSRRKKPLIIPPLNSHVTRKEPSVDNGVKQFPRLLQKPVTKVTTTTTTTTPINPTTTISQTKTTKENKQTESKKMKFLKNELDRLMNLFNTFGI